MKVFEGTVAFVQLGREEGVVPEAGVRPDVPNLGADVERRKGYIAHLSMRKLRDERGNTYYGIDEDIRDRLRSKLMQAVLMFKV